MPISKRRISLKEAAKISRYHPDYLSSLIRKGLIPGSKIGRNWFTTEEDVYQYLANQKFIPATKVWSAARRQTFVLGLSLILVLVAIGSVFFYFYQRTGSLQSYSTKELPGLDTNAITSVPTAD